MLFILLFLALVGIIAYYIHVHSTKNIGAASRRALLDEMYKANDINETVYKKYL